MDEPPKRSQDMDLVSELLLSLPMSGSTTADDGHDHAWRKVSSESGTAVQGVYRCDLCAAVWPPEAT
jgi:hypothetical protein